MHTLRSVSAEPARPGVTPPPRPPGGSRAQALQCGLGRHAVGTSAAWGGRDRSGRVGTLVAEPAERAARPLRAAPRGCSGALGTVLRPGCSGSSSGVTRELMKGMPPSAGAPRKGGASREARTELKPTCPAPRFFPRGTSEHSFCCRGDAAQGAVFPLGSCSSPRERARRQPRSRQHLWAPPGCRRRLRPPAGDLSAGHGAESDPELCRLHAVSTRARLRTSVPSSAGRRSSQRARNEAQGSVECGKV